jgi:hypothetical protein
MYSLRKCRKIQKFNNSNSESRNDRFIDSVQTEKSVDFVSPKKC